MALTLSESYSDRALVLVAALSGRLPSLSISCSASAPLSYASPGTAPLHERATIVKALATGTSLAGDGSALTVARITEWLLWSASSTTSTAAGLQALNAHLETNSFLAGTALTVADVVVYYSVHPALIAATSAPVFVAEHPALSRWLHQILHDAQYPLGTALGAPKAPQLPAFVHSPLKLFSAAANKAPAAPLATAAVAHDSAAPVAAGKVKAKASEHAAAPVAAALVEMPASAAAAAAPTAAPAAAPAPAPAAAAPDAPPAAEKKDGKKKEKSKGGDAAAASGAGAAAAAAAADPAALCEFKVGVITKVWHHPEAERLFCEEIDLAEPGGPRKIASGLRDHYTLEQMQGRRVVVVTNLKPRALVGFESNGMVLAATSPAGKVELLDPPAGAAVGTRVTVQGLPAATPAEPSAMAKKKWFDLAAEHLRVSDALQATYKGQPLVAGAAGAVTVPTAAGGSIH